MTTVAYRHGIMAADTRMIQGTAIIGSMVKIVRRDDGALAGAAGDAGWAQAFHRWFLDGEDGEFPMLEENSKGVIIRRRRKPIEMFEQGGTIVFKPPFFAMGSGKEFALGAMAQGASAEAAVEVAMRFDPGSGGNITVLRNDEA
ncbi:hypothetical protein [Bradyrhizobium ottawaense]|uniref:Uncharacterized protein n=1 Tax=Bradyrhizobium ottawaense TaxID=931866 RepID=A0ABY0QH78_9BRAD|nr:hypothetical protein [Bradyrhizobium ottawaense]SDK41836.1 hypothetical protein SAMN05444163_8064 [Bradyrhizobium ottawaense]